MYFKNSDLIFFTSYIDGQRLVYFDGKHSKENKTKNEPKTKQNTSKTNKSRTNAKKLIIYILKMKSVLIKCFKYLLICV